MHAAIKYIHGRALPLPGNDIDTDQIIESRYLKLITFQGIEQHLFKSRREKARQETGQPHPLDDPSYTGAKILLVNRNFGCGSSREHAPQAIRRFGIQAILGESFGEIFASNCLNIGLVCAELSAEAVQRLQTHVQHHPMDEFVLNIVKRTISVGAHQWPLLIPKGRSQRFLDGTWDSLEVLRSRQADTDAALAAWPVPQAGHIRHK